MLPLVSSMESSSCGVFKNACRVNFAFLTGALRDTAGYNRPVRCLNQSENGRPAALPKLGPQIALWVLPRCILDMLARPRTRLWRRQAHTPAMKSAVPYVALGSWAGRGQLDA